MGFFFNRKPAAERTDWKPSRLMPPAPTPAVQPSATHGQFGLEPDEVFAGMPRDRRRLEGKVAPIEVTVAVLTDGRLKVMLWCGTQLNATYAPVSRECALKRVLPQAIDEAIAFATAHSTTTE